MMSECNILATVILAFSSLVLVNTAAIAKNEYTMDIRSDCVAAGFLDIPRDQVIYVNGRSTNTVNQQLTCVLQFNPQTDGDTLKMWVESGSYIGDCDVSLEMAMSDNKYVFGCQSAENSIPTYEMVNGRASLRLVRKSFGDIDYKFRIGISAKRSIDPVAAGDSSSGNIGMIVGIVVGIVFAIVIAIIVCVCCYRKKQNDQSRNKGLLTKDPLSASSTCTFENAAAKNSPLDYSGSEKKLLEYENENKLKPKSALERFGPAPAKLHNNSDTNPYNSIDNNRDYSRDNNRDYHRDNSRDNNRDYSMDIKRKDEFKQKDLSDAKTNNALSKPASPEKITNIPKAPPAPPIELLTRQSSVATSSSENASERNSQNNVFFAALRKNPKFRKSFRENEADADDRARRVSSYTSTSSMASDSSKTQLPLIPLTKPATTQSQKPHLPPVPKPRPRQSSPERLGEIAGIHRARPSSSASESLMDNSKESCKPESQKKSTDVQDKTFQRTDDRKKNSSKNAQSSDSDESILERGRPKHRNKSNERQPNGRQHVKKSTKKKESDYSSSESDDTELSHGKSKHRHRFNDRNKESRRGYNQDKLSRENISKDDHSSESEGSEMQKKRSKSRNNKEVNRKQEPDEKEDRQKREKERDHERKFKKSTAASTGVRKSKGKGANKMSRSRSTGSALEELESNYSQSKSQGSVRSLNLNFVDEDIDLDSNLQPFKRAGSKTSLYASRTSLYGRRRKNSMGETVSLSSYMYDDVESRISDFDRASISQKDKARMFKSTGDLELKLQSSVVVRDCSTWTGSTKGVEVFERKTLTKNKPDKRYNRGTQTGSDRDRTNSIASEASVYSTHYLKSRSKSQESLGSNRRRRTHKKDDKTKSPYHSRSDVRSHEDKKGRSRSRVKSSDSDSTAYTLDTSDGSSRTDQSSVKLKPKPKPKQHVLEAHNTDTSYLENESVISAPSSSYIPYQPPVNSQYIPVNYPISSYPQHGANYLVPPPNSVPVVVQNIPMIKPAVPPKPHQASSSSSSKWDQLVNLTEGMKKRRHQMGESVDTESVMSSVWSEFTPYGGQHHLHYASVNDPNRTYSTSYPESLGPLIPPQYGVYHNESDL